MYTPADRDRIRALLADKARDDERIAAAALVGSLVTDQFDRWSDVDLTFGVADGFEVRDVLEDWTRDVTAELDATPLLDLESGGAIYRVFLLPNCLQVDLSFAPVVRQGTPRFQLLFGDYEAATPSPPRPAELFGWAVHYAHAARVCIERGRLWQAEHCISQLRDNALGLACAARGLPARFGKGLDAVSK